MSVPNEYAGFTPREGWRPQVVSACSDPRSFFDSYVKTRTPVVLDGIPSNFDPAKWRKEAIGPSARRLRVDVEVRDSGTACFGRGNKVSMPFGDLLERLGGEDAPRYYMTTQALPEDEDGPTVLHGPPLAGMQDAFPWRLPLLGNLRCGCVRVPPHGS